MTSERLSGGDTDTGIEGLHRAPIIETDIDIGIVVDRLLRGPRSQLGTLEAN